MIHVRLASRPLRSRFVLFVLALSLGLTPILRAQQQDFAFERFTSEDGLTSDVVSVIIQDHLGFLWMGTHSGLLKYDGYTFTTYKADPVNPHRLKDRHVSALLEDHAGDIWVGTGRGGLSRFDRETERFTQYQHDPDDPNSLSSTWVSSILEDEPGLLWIATLGGLDRLDTRTGRFTHYRHDPDNPNGLSSDSLLSLYKDRKGMLWIGSTRSLDRFDPEQETFTRFLHDPSDPTSLSFNFVSAILEDRAGRLWVGSYGGYYGFSRSHGGGLDVLDRETGTFTHFRHDPADSTSLGSEQVSALFEDREGNLWVGHWGTGGLDRMDPASGRFIRYQHDPNDPASLPQNWGIMSILEDRSGMLWIGTGGGYLSKADRSRAQFRHYTYGQVSSPDATEVTAIAASRRDSASVWIGTTSGLMQFNRSTGRLMRYRQEAPVPWTAPDGEITALYQDTDGVLWIGTAAGLYRLDVPSGRLTSYRSGPDRTESLCSDEVTSIVEDHQRVLWIGSYDADYGGITRLDRQDGSIRCYRQNSDDAKVFNPRYVLVVYEAPSEPSMLWVGTNGGGLNRFDTRTGRFTSYFDPYNLSSVRSIYEDRAGRLWVGTYADGLHRFDRQTGRSTRYDEQAGLANDIVMGILEDEQGRLWLSTLRGLSRFDPAKGTFTNFDAEGGVQDLTFNRGAALSTSDGELFFGGATGLTSFFPERIEANPHPPQVALTGFRLFDQPVVPGPKAPLRRHISTADEVVLGHRQNDLSFDFVGLHYEHPERNHYAYMLEGYDEAWREAGTQRTATYTNLSPGRYVYRVKAANADGLWNEEGTSIRMVILPPWWRTGWAYLFYGLLFAAGAFAVDRVQRRRLIRKEREKAREREVEQAREIEAANTRLRAHEQHLEEQNALLQQQNTQIEVQSEQLRELDAVKARFFANISHEFRTPLTLLLGPIQDALKAGDPERLGEHLPLMQRNAERLLVLIGQLLDLSKLEAGGMHLRAREVDLVPWLRQLTHVFVSRAEHQGLRLLFNPAIDTLPCCVDVDKLEKVVLNLLSNAIKFTDPGGKIRVRLRKRRDDTRAWAEIAVQDTGRGIPEAALPYIFDRFWQVDEGTTRAREGTGIGLALVRELVTLHQGTITVESTEGFGTTFTVRLPLGREHLQESEMDKDAGATAAVPVGAVSARALEGDNTAGLAYIAEQDAADAREAPTVLVVEDNADMRAYLRSQLAPHYRLAEATDGATGLEAARRLKPDLIISDVMMPEVDGYELCRQVKSNPKLNHIPVVLLTARADEVSRLEGLETGADDYLTKPFNAEELLVRVENLVELRRKLRAHFGGQVVVGPSQVVVTSAEAAFMEQVRDMVEAHLGDTNFGVDQLAAEVGLSARQLLRRVKETAGLTPAGYIRLMRLERAAQLLRQQAGTVSEVAYRVGFQDAYYFSKLFRQVFGVPPSEYATGRH